MDAAFRYLILVQVIERKGCDLFFGSVPDFGIEIYEAVNPGDLAQEYLFHLKLRRLIAERLSACRAQGIEAPLIRLAHELSPTLTPPASPDSTQTVSTTAGARMLGVHPDTIRALFDAGVLRGSLTKGGQRMILVTSLEEEEARMTQRAQLRTFELRSKKKNAKRRQRRTSRLRQEKLNRLNENKAEVNKPL